MKLKLNKGFTLIEMLVVIAIIAILGAIAAPGIMSKMNDARGAQLVSNIDTILTAVASELGSEMDADYTSTASIQILKGNKRIKSNVKGKDATAYLPGAWKSKLNIASATSGTTYYLGIQNMKTEEGCKAVVNLFKKKAITFGSATKALTGKWTAAKPAVVGPPAVDAIPATFIVTAKPTLKPVDCTVLSKAGAKYNLIGEFE